MAFRSPAACSSSARVHHIGIDLESVLAGDLFGAARVALSMQRALDNAESRRIEGTIPATTTIPAREALRWITIEGARMLGREDHIGSLTPGKLADLVVINANDLNLFPVHDPVSTVVMQTSLANIEAVMIDGVWKKRDGRLLVDGLDDEEATAGAIRPTAGARYRTTRARPPEGPMDRQYRHSRTSPSSASARWDCRCRCWSPRPVTP